MPISVVIIESDVESLNGMVKYIKELGDHVVIEGAVTSYESGFELIHKKRPMVVIMDIGEGGTCNIDRIPAILERFPQVTIFAICGDKSSDSILKAMRAGATEYLLKPVVEADLASALQKVGRLWITKPSPETASGRVFTIFSPKGGVGVTTLAVNLATNIYEISKEPTLLVDLDLDAGDVTTFLNLKPSYTISDVTVNISRIDKSFLKGVIAKHESGIHILAEPKKVEEGRSVSGAELKKVLDLLKTMFHYIIIDTESVLDERITTAIEISDMLFLTFILSLPNIKHIQRYLNYIEKMVARDKIRLIVNRYLKKGEIKIEDAEDVLRHKIYWHFPNDYENAMACLNKGVPLSTGASRSQLNLALKEMAKAITDKK